MNALLYVTFFVAAPSISVDSSEVLYQLIRDSQVDNQRRYNHGYMHYKINHMITPGKRSIEFEAKLRWLGDDALWVFRYCDPDGINFRELPPGDLEQQPFHQCFKDHKKLYVYNSGRNILGVSGNRDTFSQQSYLEVGPKALWFRCCPPSHLDGRPWVQMIGPDSPTLLGSATMTIERIGADMIRQTRRDADGGSFETTFSLQHSGNVVENRYLSGDSSYGSSEGTYTWEKIPDGRCVLRRYTYRAMAAGSRTEVVERYELVIDEIDVTKPIDRSKLTFEWFKASLPRDVFVIDHSQNKSYFLNKVEKSGSSELDELVREIGRRGFLKSRR